MTTTNPTLSHQPAGASTVPLLQRRVVIVRRNLQVKYALILLGLLGAACFMVWWEMSRSLLGLFNSGDITDPELLGMIRKMFVVVGAKTALFLGVAWVLAIALAHTIIRSIYQFERSFERLKTGDLTHRIHLGPNDEFKFLGVEFNETLRALQQKGKADVEKVRALAQVLNDVSKESGSPIKEDLQKLSKVLESFRSSFRLQ